MEIERYEQDNFTVRIGYDECSWMYDDLWYGVSFISNHRDYINAGKLENLSIEDVFEGNVPEGYEYVKVHAYIHGQIALNFSGFNCPWDSGTFGFLVFKTGEFGENNVGLEGFLKHWEAILNGNIYYFTIENEHEVLESCGGFDDMDYMKEEIDIHLKDMVQCEKEKRTAKLKAQIKHRVPLEKRVG